MAFENRNIVYIVAGLMAITASLYIVANALPIWSKVSVQSQTGTYGLWKLCHAHCTNLPSTVADAKIMSARAFITISCILSIVFIASLISILFIDENLKKKIASLSKILVIASLISGIIGVALGITYAMEMKYILIVDNNSLLKQSPSMGVSSILAIIAIVFNLGSAMASLYIK